MSTIRKFLKDESGATAIEYGLIAALVSVAIIVTLGAARQQPEPHVHGGRGRPRGAAD